MTLMLLPSAESTAVLQGVPVTCRWKTPTPSSDTKTPATAAAVVIKCTRKGPLDSPAQLLLCSKSSQATYKAVLERAGSLLQQQWSCRPTQSKLLRMLLLRSHQSPQMQRSQQAHGQSLTT